MKRMIVALMFVGMASGLSAQGFLYNPSNTPTTGGSNSWPFNVYTDWRFQFNINAAVLPAAPFKIIDIAFAPGSSTTVWSAQQFQVRMGHTTSTLFSTAPGAPSFDAQLGPCPTVCYNGPLNWGPLTAGMWNNLGLQCDFGYDGQRSINCELRYQNRTTTGITVYTDPSIARAYTHNNYSANPYSEPNWFVPIPGEFLGPKHCLTIDRTNVLIAPDTCSIAGGPVGIGIVQATSPGDSIQVAASLGQSTLLIPGPNGRLCLDPDGVFFASVLGFAPAIFGGYLGTVGAAGSYTARFDPPNITALVGICVYHGAAIFNGGGIQGLTNTDGTRLDP